MDYYTQNWEKVILMVGSARNLHLAMSLMFFDQLIIYFLSQGLCRKLENRKSRLVPNNSGLEFQI